METKICPLFWASGELPAEARRCKGQACTWWVPPQGHRDGHCAMQDLGALPVIAAEVGRI